LIGGRRKRFTRSSADVCRRLEPVAARLNPPPFYGVTIPDLLKRPPRQLALLGRREAFFEKVPQLLPGKPPLRQLVADAVKPAAFALEPLLENAKKM
jgi:hypothetical protein